MARVLATDAVDIDPHRAVTYAAVGGKLVIMVPHFLSKLSCKVIM